MTKIKKETKVVKTPKQKVTKTRKPLKKKPVKNKKVKTTKIENVEKVPKEFELNYEKLNIDLNQVKKGVEALLQYTEKHESKDLFKGQQQIFVQLKCVRIPSGPNRKLRIKLQHPLITIDNEICLIVPDLKRGRKVDHEETIEHYENLLRSKNVTYIKRILPLRQLRVEYDQFELKRRLCGYYDYFLVDGRISGHVLHLLGKSFADKRKQPVPVQLNSDNLNDVILKAMSKTELNIHSQGDTYIVQIGHTDMPVENVVDNLKVIVNSVVSSFPGKWENVRALHVKTDKSIAIPVYYTMKDANEVQIPKVKRPKVGGEAITEEIGTRLHTVTVYPDGRVDLNHPLAKKYKLAEKARKNALNTKSGKIKKKTVKKPKSPKKVKSQPNGHIKTEKPKSPKKVKSEPNGHIKSAVKVKKESVSPKKIKIEKTN